MKSPFRVAVISDQIAQVFVQVCEVVAIYHMISSTTSRETWFNAWNVWAMQ